MQVTNIIKFRLRLYCIGHKLILKLLLFDKADLRFSINNRGTVRKENKEEIPQSKQNYVAEF